MQQRWATERRHEAVARQRSCQRDPKLQQISRCCGPSCRPAPTAVTSTLMQGHADTPTVERDKSGLAHSDAASSRCTPENHFLVAFQALGISVTRFRTVNAHRWAEVKTTSTSDFGVAKGDPEIDAL